MERQQAAPTTPTEDRVRSACREFDKDNLIAEQALKDLFSQYPRNDNESHVLLKVVALNRLYSTNILAVHDMARHIFKNAQDIDPALAIGSPEVVDRIARFTIATTGKERTSYSFAAKYCSWHNQGSYPIWDSRVDRYLRSMRRTTFAKLLSAHGDLWNHYPEFVALMTAFKDFYSLGSFNFKDIDKFIWINAGKPPATEPPHA